MKYWTISLAALLLPAAQSQAAVCFFAPRGQEITQPAQKVFLDWDADRGVETLILQPSFAGEVTSFGLVIATPSRPTVGKVARDFFTQLEVFTLKKTRAAAAAPRWRATYGNVAPLALKATEGTGFFQSPDGRSIFDPAAAAPRQERQAVDAGVLDPVCFKVFAAQDSEQLLAWLRKHDYELGSRDTFTRDVQNVLTSLARENGYLTVIQLDASRLRGGTLYRGQVAPLRLQFRSERPVYPLRMTGLSAPGMDLQIYLQGPTKMDLPGDLTYQYQWATMIRNLERNIGVGNFSIRPGSFGGKNLPGGASDFITAVGDELVDRLLRLAFARGFPLNLNSYGYEPRPGTDGKMATVLQWAKRLTASDLDVLTGRQPYSDATLVRGSGAGRETYVRLPALGAALREGAFLSRLHRKVIRAEMTRDLVITPARLGKVEDNSEYVEFLPNVGP